MGKITIETEGCCCTAKNCKLSKKNLEYLEGRYEDKGFSFYNDYLETAVVMEWEDTVEQNIIDEAKSDFEDCVSPA